MSIAINILTARIPSPRAFRVEARPPSISEDKADGLGYNRELIDAAQALRFDSVQAISISTAESNCAIRLRASGGPSPVMATGTKEVRYDAEI